LNTNIVKPCIVSIWLSTSSDQKFSCFEGLFLVAAGVVVFRWDINISGLLIVIPYMPGQAIAYTSYRASIIELLTGSAIVARREISAGGRSYTYRTKT